MGTNGYTQEQRPLRTADILQTIPEQVLVSLMEFWTEGRLCEWHLQRYDREWKVKIGGYQKGKF